MTVAVTVEQIDPRDAAAFDEWFAVVHAIDDERWPGQPGWLRVERLAMALDEDGPEEHRLLVARHGGRDDDRGADGGRDDDRGTDGGRADGGRAIGCADIELHRRENLQLARIDVRVLPDHRRHGVGSALLRVVEQIANAAGRSELGGLDETPVRPGDASPYEDAAGPFARARGFTCIQQLIRRQLLLPLDPDHARALADSPKAHPPGYTMQTFLDRWPDELVEDRCELGRRMSTDVPMGDQELDEEVWDAARVRQIESSFAAQNRAKVITVALDNDDGRAVGFTEIAVPLGAPESVWQHDTLVMREHRGHGLGFALKVANLIALAREYPQVRRVSTWNAAENAHMIAVNEEMGFEVASLSSSWLKQLR